MMSDGPPGSSRTRWFSSGAVHWVQWVFLWAGLADSQTSLWCWRPQNFLKELKKTQWTWRTCNDILQKTLTRYTIQLHTPEHSSRTEVSKFMNLKMYWGKQVVDIKKVQLTMCNNFPHQALNCKHVRMKIKSKVTLPYCYLQLYLSDWPDLHWFLLPIPLPYSTFYWD